MILQQHINIEGSMHPIFYAEWFHLLLC